MADERRQHDRIFKKCRVGMEKFCFPLSKGEATEVSCLNISVGGLLVETKEHFEVGDKVQVSIYIMNLNKFHPSYFKVFESDVGSSLNAVAEVVRVLPGSDKSLYQFGIQFVDIYEDDWKALYGLLKKELIEIKKKSVDGKK